MNGMSPAEGSVCGSCKKGKQPTQHNQLAISSGWVSFSVNIGNYLRAWYRLHLQRSSITIGERLIPKVASVPQGRPVFSG